MCGIAGVIGLDNAHNIQHNIEIVRKMTDVLRHRGPDGEGVECASNGLACLGHRRLSIIDLSDSASQPMKDFSGRYVIVYNGELYNFREIRKELEGLGYQFRTNSDTEVVLQAFIEWREAALKKFNGMFAFAIWDSLENRLFLARDRYGIKPIYYATIGNQFVFASEYKAILIHPGYKRELDLCSLKQYFTFQNILNYRSFLKGIALVKPGHYITVEENGLKLRENKYWDFSFEEDYSISSYEEAEEELSRLFSQAVKRQMVSDVPVGTFLSGGIDSGMITAVSSMEMPFIKSFTCGMDLHSASGIELGFDEREKAEYLSYCYKTEHYEMVLKAGDMERCMKDLVWHIEDPRVGQSYPNYYASKLSSKFVKVVLAGTGGDEIFAGYPWRYYKATNSKTFNDYVSNYYDYWQRLISEEEMSAVFSPIIDSINEYDMKSIFADVIQNGGYAKNAEMTPEESVNISLYFEAKTFLHGLLIVEDKLSMAHGLETRVPFLDNDLVDFAQKIPVRFKLAHLDRNSKYNENDLGPKSKRYYDINKDGKMILRNVSKRYVPEMIYDGKKQGFSAPDASWFRGDSIEYVRSVISNPNSYIYNYLDKVEIERIFLNHCNGTTNRRLFIWSILNFEEWLKLFYGRI